MSQVSPPGAVRLSAPWNEAEAHEWTLPCSSLVHSPQLFTAEVSPQTSPMCPAGPGRQGQQAQPGQEALEAEPCP